jgi:hypothetical protein
MAAREMKRDGQVAIFNRSPNHETCQGRVCKGMNSCQKGKRGERAWRDELIAHGYQARRGRQFSGSPDSPDVVCPDLRDFHFEGKTVERLRIHEAMAQAINDAGGKIPVVAHKRNRGEWLITMRATDWFKLGPMTSSPTAER